jgi:hypothetical protein
MEKKIEYRKIKYRIHMYRHVHCTYAVQDIKAHRQTDRHTGGQTDRYGETDGQAAGKQAERQTDK